MVTATEISTRVKHSRVNSRPEDPFGRGKQGVAVNENLFEDDPSLSRGLNASTVLNPANNPALTEINLDIVLRNWKKKEKRLTGMNLLFVQ